MATDPNNIIPPSPYETVPATVGGDTTILSAEDTEQANMIPLWRLQSFSPELPYGTKLQDVYGTAGMPMFQWVRKVQAGEIPYDPDVGRDVDDYYRENPGEEGAEEWRQYASLAGLAVQSGVSAAGTESAKVAAKGLFGRPAPTSGEFVDKLTDFTTYGIGSTPDQQITEQFIAATGTTPGVNQQLVKTGSATDRMLAQQGKPSETTILDDGSEVSLYKKGDVSNVLKGADKPITQYQTLEGITKQVPSGTTKFTQAQLDADAALAPEGGDFFMDAGMAADPTDVVAGDPGFFDTGGTLDTATTGYYQSPAQVGIGFGLDLGMNLLSGQKPLEAVKNSAISTAATYVGTAMFGPVGGFVAGTIAKVATGGGSVICNELYVQKQISYSQCRIMAYYATVHLNPATVKGYHFWAVPVVKRLQKKKGVKLWTYIVNHWTNHISYKSGIRKKPDYIGLALTTIGEPISWTIGRIYELTKEKEFKYGY